MGTPPKSEEPGMYELKQQLPDLDIARDVRILFATHSIPSDDAERSGPRDREFGEGGAYAAQHLAVSEVIAQATGEGAAWDLVYQSRSGPPTQPWLEPDINDAIAELPAEGIRAVLIVPIGFVSDHLEVLWDLDTEAMETARDHGLAAVRVRTPGSHRAYVRGLVDLVLERREGVPATERPAMTDLGPSFDVCRPGCCENIRAGFKPAAAGVAP